MNKIAKLVFLGGFGVFAASFGAGCAVGSEEPNDTSSTGDELRKCTGPLPMYILQCADGTAEGPHWGVKHGKCKLIAACTNHGGPRRFGPTVVGAGESCNPTVSPEFATVCEDGLTCVHDRQLMGAPGICLKVVGEGERCNPTVSPAYATICEDGFECRADRDIPGSPGTCQAPSDDAN